MAKGTTKKKIVTAIVGTLTGVSGITVASALIAYDSIFPRFERPNYALVAGEYCYERVQDELAREEFFFQAGKSTLKGYYYPSNASKGLVVVVHGFRSGSDDYLPITKYLVQHGYNVFSYDCTGTYDSQGEGMVGWCQSLVDLDNTLAYLQSTAPYRDQPLFLLGHSWGGYAVSSVLALKSGIRACACIAPMYNGSTIMQEKGEQYVGKLAVTSKPVFGAYQRILFGSYVEYNGVRGINSVDIPVLIAQGVDDKIITYDGQSITAHKKEITNPNVSYYIGKGLQGSHDGIWHSKDALVYQSEVESELKLLQIEKGKPLTAQEKAEFYKTVDHSLYSAVNEALMNEIIKTFNKTFCE